MKKRIKAVIFDIGGVLLLTKNQKQENSCLHRNLGVHEYVANKLKISIDQYFDSIDSTYVKSVEGKISEKQVLKIISANLKISEEKLKKIYKIAYNRVFKKNKPLFKTTLELKKMGYKIVVLSDQWHLSKKSLLSKKILKEFDVKILSCDVEMRKPNPEIYKLILKKLKLKPSEALFIDNQKWNLPPAKKIGLKTILFRNNKQLFKDKLWKNLY